MGIKVEILDLKQIKKLKMGALLEKRKSNTMSQNGNKSKTSNKVFFWKGTFDTGYIYKTLWRYGGYEWDIIWMLLADEGFAGRRAK